MYLCIDTTSSNSGITIIGKKSVYTKIDPYHASEKIIGIIDEALKKSGVELKDLKGVFVIKGPGSFTGLRVGIAVANQFAHQLNIPITGLKAEEWWSKRTDEKDFVYLQSMNKAEVYFDGKIIPIEKLSGKKSWLGELSDDHRQKLPSGFKEITDILSPEETWSKITESKLQPACRQAGLQSTIYNLIEPFYGKEPTITKSKKKLSI